MRLIKMNDAEINLTIAKIEHPNESWRTTHEDGVSRIAGQELIAKDYVNNWADIGPIIEREGIDLAYDGTVWSTYGLDKATLGVCAKAETPTKAAALAFLKIKGVEL
jgi:hypothetical protein